MIVAENLTRKYGDFVAVSDVSFEISPGEVVGLLGHNGAGKTTIMKMLTGFLEPTAGRVMIDGVDLEDDRAGAQAKMGYLPENPPIYPEMTVVEFLDYAAEMRQAADQGRNDAIRRAIDATDLHEKVGDPISSLSRGYRQRVGVAQAIINNPKIVILDEPTNGLDPSQIHHMRETIRSLSETATVILSTHILQEVEAVCDRVIIVNRGRMALDTPLADVGRGAGLVVGASLDPAAATDALGGLGGGAVRHVRTEAGRHIYELPLGSLSADAVAPQVARAVIERGGDLYALHPASRDLDAVFSEISSGRPEPEAGAEQTTTTADAA